MNATDPRVLIQDGLEKRQALADVMDQLDSLTAGEFHSNESRVALHQAWWAVQGAQVAVEQQLGALGYEPGGQR